MVETWRDRDGPNVLTIPVHRSFADALAAGVLARRGDDPLALVGGTILLPRGRYLVSKKTGVNDAWGIKITQSNTVLKGENGAELKRYSTDISTYAQAYTVLFIGVPDDDGLEALRRALGG